VGGQCYAT